MQVKKEVVIMKIIEEFANKFNSNIRFANRSIVNKNDRLFLLEKKLAKYPKGFFHAGLYLGKIKKGKIIPSLVLFMLVDFIVERISMLDINEI